MLRYFCVYRCVVGKMHFTNSEHFDLLEAYFKNDRNCSRALHWYHIKYPTRILPTRKIFIKIVHNLKTHGSFKKPKNVKPRKCDENMEMNILTYFEATPDASTRNASRDIPEISRPTIHRTLKKYKYKCYKNGHWVQALHAGDDIRRLEFCNWIKETMGLDRHFLKYVIFSDETQFSNNGMYNRKNHHYWSRENPLRIHEGRRQVRFSFNCWVGLLHNKVLLFKIYDGHLDRFKYLAILEDLLAAVGEMPAEVREQLYFQQDGAPAHNSRIARDFLNENFSRKWIGTNGPIKWPARSPDLTPLDYFLWGYVKDEVYKTSYDTIEDLKAAIESILTQIHHIKIQNSILRSLPKRVDYCIEKNGGHFEHLL